MTPMNTSEILTAAEKLAHSLREIMTQRGMVESEIAELTRKNDDIVHRMERDGCLYKERARLATELRRVRIQRRALKDWLHDNEPYFKYIGTDGGVKVQNMITNLVGIGRRVKPQ